VQHHQAAATASRFSEMLNRQLRALWDAISAVADAIDGLEQP